MGDPADVEIGYQQMRNAVAMHANRADKAEARVRELEAKLAGEHLPSPWLNPSADGSTMQASGMEVRPWEIRVSDANGIARVVVDVPGWVEETFLVEPSGSEELSETVQRLAAAVLWSALRAAALEASDG